MFTVLIVDDDVGMSSLLAKLLKLNGYQAEAVASGEAAIAYFAKHVPDAMILDIMMPGMNGFEVLQRIRVDAVAAACPVIMFSAVSDGAYERKARSLGAVDYWIKGSVDFDQLGAELDRHIAKSKPPETPGPTTMYFL